MFEIRNFQVLSERNTLIAGITTVLTMTFLGLEARTDLPKVAYPTALDFFVFLSFAFIFATIIQVRTLICAMKNLLKLHPEEAAFLNGLKTISKRVDYLEEKLS